jgi:hypothetical protein
MSNQAIDVVEYSAESAIVMQQVSAQASRTWLAESPSADRPESHEG